MLEQKAMLVSLSVTKPKMTEKDKCATIEVATDKHAAQEAVAVIKRLYPKALLAPITEVESAARRYVDSVTQPWVRGMSLLPCKLFMEFQSRIGSFRVQFQQAVTVFLNNYANVMTQAQQQQGAMFDASAYPDLAHLKADFTFDVTYMPLAAVSSIVLDLEAGALAAVKQEVEAETTRRLADGQKVMYERLAGAVKRIHVQCSKENGRIHDSLTGNLAELLTVLPYLNIAEDTVFSKLCDDARVLVVSPEALRTQDDARISAVNAADDILKRMTGFI